MNTELLKLQEIVRAAGKIALQSQKTHMRHKDKKDGTMLTSSDLEVDAFIFTKLREAFPGDSIRSEEGSRYKGTTEREWIFDPIDGTREFARGGGQYVVQIGSHKNGVPEYGAIYQPTINTLWWGGLTGTFENEKPMRLREETKEVVQVGHRTDARRSIAGKFIQTSSEGLRWMHVVRGNADFMYRTRPLCHLWDTLAPHALLIGIGAYIPYTDGTEIDYRQDDTIVHAPYIVAKNKQIFDRALTSSLQRHQ